MKSAQEDIEQTSAPPNAEAPARPVIMVVDDEPMVGEILAAVLDMEGYKTHLFTDPAQALEYITGGMIRPDLLIADFAMGPLNGLELIERAREALPDLPTILCSGAFEDIFNGASVRPTAFLSKPFLPREMLKAVAKLVAAPALSN